MKQRPEGDAKLCETQPDILLYVQSICFRKLWTLEDITRLQLHTSPDVPRQYDFFSLRTITERISMKFAGDNHYHQSTDGLSSRSEYYSIFCAKLYQGKGSRIRQKIRIDDVDQPTSHVPNDFRNFTVRHGASAELASPLQTCNGGGIICNV